uniref:F-box domain-containing protein n=1 Tax=Davidia involucrata TaxID=16924 RepID=A0A5B7AAN1_DAVIN
MDMQKPSSQSQAALRHGQSRGRGDGKSRERARKPKKIKATGKARKRAIKLKKIKAMESRLPHIPAEIVNNILSRLPVKSILRFKSVCKPWLSLLSDPKFCFSIERHRVVVSATSRSKRSFSFHSIDDASVKELPNPWKGRSFLIFGSCNGLLLINIGADLFLWNPSTLNYRKMLTYDCLLGKDYSVMSTGLCYDSSANDYKAVIGLARKFDFVVVGSFKINPPKKVHFPYYINSPHRGPVVNGLLHWSVSNRNGYISAPHLIIYFDPVKDEFKELPIPQPIHYNVILGLGVLGGCLCMVRWVDESDSEGNIEVLVMKEYGVKESWNTMFIISNLIMNPLWGRLEPLCFTRDGEILMLLKEGTHKNKILAYNPGAKSHRIIAIPTNHSRNVDAATYVESLGQRQKKDGEKPKYIVRDII